MSLHDQIEYWSQIAGRPLTKFEQMVIARPFKYSKYWHTWDRVLKPVFAGTPYGYVEFALTPVNGWDIPVCGYESRMAVIRRNNTKTESLGEIKIRVHSTVPEQGDKYASSLPEEARQQLVDELGQEKVQYMLYGNIFDHVDWDLYQKIKVNHQGGVPLALCSKSVGADSMAEFDNQRVRGTS